MTFKKLLVCDSERYCSNHAPDEFVVEDNEVKGLQRVALGAALTYIQFGSVMKSASCKFAAQFVHFIPPRTLIISMLDVTISRLSFPSVSGPLLQILPLTVTAT